jgi:heme oxygenase (biliverdin-IX-beta and delta-forming)
MVSSDKTVGGDVRSAAAEAPRPSQAERARTLLESNGVGTLCTIASEPAGYPFGSLVAFAGLDGTPVLLLSDLAEHTRNLHADARASLLIAEAPADAPLAGARVTLVGRCSPLGASEQQTARTAYLARHPSARAYAALNDFKLYQLQVETARVVAGFGRMAWLSAAEWHAARPDPIAPTAAEIIAHMNQDHADVLPLYCVAFSNLPEPKSVRMTGIDRLGFDLSATTSSGSRTLRIAFHEPIASSNDARRALIALLTEARAKLRS